MAEKCCHSDGILAISISRDNHTVGAHYSRQRVIAYLLRTDISIETDWPFSSMQRLFHHVWRTIYGSHVNCAHIHLAGRNRRSVETQSVRYTSHVMHDLTASAFIQATLSITHRISMQRCLASKHDSLCCRLNGTRAPSSSWDSADARCCVLWEIIASHLSALTNFHVVNLPNEADPSVRICVERQRVSSLSQKSFFLTASVNTDITDVSHIMKSEKKKKTE